MPKVQTKTQEELDREEHTAAVDLRIVQVGAVAVGREVLRLLDEVEAGRYDVGRVYAVLVGCHNMPENLADALTKGAKVTRDVVAQAQQRLLRTLVEQFRMVRTAETGKEKACRVDMSVGESSVWMGNLEESAMGLVSRAMQHGVDAARGLLELLLRDLPAPAAPTPRAPLTQEDGSVDWLGLYAHNVIGMPLAEVESADRAELAARAAEHMKRMGSMLEGGPVVLTRDRDAAALKRLEVVARQLRSPEPVSTEVPVEPPPPIFTTAMRMSEVALRRFFATASEKEIEEQVDAGIRHQPGARTQDFIRHWCAVGRHFGYATRDDSLGELEKLFAIMVKRLVMAERRSPPPAE